MKVLVMGLRKPVLGVLEAQGIPYGLWSSQPTKHQASLGTLVAPVLTAPPDIVAQLDKSFKDLSFTHVIAATEEFVYLASQVRRLVNARLSEQTMVLHCRDKVLMKQHLRYHHIPMTRFVDGSTSVSAEEIWAKLGSPVVVKDRDQSGGRGLVFAKSLIELQGAMDTTRIYEKMVSAPEGSVESFVQNGEIRFTNITHYKTKTHINILPAPFAETEVAKILELNRKVIAALKIDWGLTHLEFYRTEDGPVFGEIALRPPGGYIMKLISLAYGFSAWQAFVAVELGQDFVFPKGAEQFAAVYIVHPGVGKVDELEALNDIENEPWVHEYKIKQAAGLELKGRESVREELGHIIFVAPSAEEIEERLQLVLRNLKLRVSGKDYQLPS